MFLKFSINEFGTQVAHYKCSECDKEYSICPAPILYNKYHWNVCSAADCESFNPSIDIDPIFMSEENLMACKIVSIKALRTRRELKSKGVIK